MGALTSNRKRNDEFLNLHYKQQSLQPYCNSPSVQNSKRQKLSISMQQPPERSISSKSAVSRISRYPEVTPKLKRELHAPVRSGKFPLNKLTKASSSGASGRVESSWDHMGNWLSYNYNKAKQSALKTLRYLGTEKEVIDVIDVDEPVKGSVVSDDSSIEEIGGVEDGRAGKSVQSDYWRKDVVGTVGNGQESMVSELSNGNVRVENAEMMLDSLTLDQDGVQVLSKSTYKKLLEKAQKHDIKIDRLDFEIKLNQEKRLVLQELRPVKKVEEVPREPFLPLTDADEDRVRNALSSGSRRKVLVTHENSNIEITGHILQCLRPGAWLNDEVINLYLELLKEREKREPEKFLKCHFFNTFFYKKLIGGRAGYDYKSVRRWTTQRKLGYFLKDCDKIFVPIHKEIHWCLAIINKQDKKFQYLDSLGGRDSQVLKILARYFIDEVKDKSGEDIDVGSWEQEYVEDLPEQENGFDCGMFMIKYADFYSRGLGLCFSQEHMPYFRLRTAKEILSLRAD